MPTPTDYAILEYRFMRFDKRFRGLASDSHRLHYLAWWALSVFERPRTDWWVLRKDIDLITFGDSLGFPPETTAETVLAFLRDTIENGLARRARGGAYVLIGTRDKHEKLRNWRPKIGSALRSETDFAAITPSDFPGQGASLHPRNFVCNFKTPLSLTAPLAPRSARPFAHAASTTRIMTPCLTRHLCASAPPSIPRFEKTLRRSSTLVIHHRR